MEQPKRKVQLTLVLGADSIRDAINELEHIQFRLLKAEDQNESEISVVSGGYSTRSNLSVSIDPDMDHNKYIDELEKYIEFKSKAN